MFTKHRGELYLILGALTFSFNGVIVTLVLDHISSFRLAQVRSLGAFALLFTLAMIKDRTSLKATRSELPTLAFYGIFGYAAVQLGYFIGIARNVPLSLVLILEFTAPIWIVLWIKFVRKGVVARSMWLAIFLSLIGLVLVAKVWEGLTLDLLGVLAAIGSAIALAIYFLVGEKMGKDRSAQSLTVWGLGFAGLTWLIALPVWNFPFEIFTEQINLQGRFSDYSLPGGVLLAWIIVMGTMVPYLFVVGGLRRLDASKASVMGMLEPVLAGIFAWIWLSQSWTPIQLLGGLIVLIGIYVADKTKNEAKVK